MTTDADVIVAGAGPAGSMAAYTLARQGISVLILEKAQFPRYKVCGAGLTHKILAEIPFDVSPVFETSIHNIVFSSGFKEVFKRTSAEPMLYCTMRDKFDHFLLRKAIEAGAKILYDVKVTGVKQERDVAIVETNTRSFSSRIIIGADGASGIVARSAGLRNHIMQGLAWEAEVTADPAIVRAYSQTVFLDWGAFPGGYGWVFPKQDHFSIGVGGPASLTKGMMNYYEGLIAYLADGPWLSGSGSSAPNTASGGRNRAYSIRVLETLSMKAWPIPVRVEKSMFHNGRVMVAGDAAGLTDPLTGEGIYYAVRSGKLAAEVSLKFLLSATPTLASYSEAVNEELMSELLEANRIKYLFNTIPLRIHRLVRDNDRGWRAFGKVLRGERWYADVRKGFGKWKMLWGLACLVSKWVSGYREKRFASRIKHQAEPSQ
ncbi:MAG: geranylgeranyl reductase family protein [Bacteroidota bacterium]